MSSMSLPPGFRFHPTDDELVGYYLKRKVDGLSIELEVIPVIDLYKFDPWELPEKSFLPKRDMEWFFFCPRDKKYPNGSRTNRATRSGYWKATGKDRKVFCESSVQGHRKTLVFYTGRAPGGARTNWMMHEYRLCEDLCQATPNFMGAFALCRVVKRNEQVLKMGGDSHGQSNGKRCLFSATSDFTPRKIFNKELASVEHSAETGSIFEINSNSPQIAFSDMHGSVSQNNQKTTLWETQNLCAPKDYSLEQSLFSEPVHPAQFPNVSTDSYPSSSISHVSSYASLTEETFMVDELNTQENFTSYPSPLHHMNVYGNEEDVGIFQGLNWEMPPYMNAPIHGYEACNTTLHPSMCRQASDVEEASLWIQEDNMLVVI